MTYLQFHGIFTLPVLPVLIWLVRGKLVRAHFWCMGAVTTISVIFALFWDHTAIAQKLWDFPAAQISGRFWRIPLDEIAFFILESLEVCLLAIWFLPSPKPGEAAA